MSYTYKLKAEAQGRVFINTVTNEDGTITSQVPLESPYVELVQSTAPAPNYVAGVAPQNQQPVAPVTATVPQAEQTPTNEGAN